MNDSKRHLLPISLITIGFIGFFAVCLNNIAFKLTIQENNLLVGVVDEKLRDIDNFKNVYNLFSQLRTKIDVQAQIESLSLEYGLDFATQDFTYQRLGSNRTVSGRNYYSIVRSSSSSQLETVVFSAPLMERVDDYIGSVITLFYLSKYLKKQVYLAKDVIILFVDQGEIGAQAWLESYHSVKKSRSIKHSDLTVRSGSIEAAFNIVFPLHPTHVKVEMTGLNGQMPCLDLVATAVSLCQKHDFPVRLNNIPMGKYYDDPVKDVHTYFLSAYRQAVNSPEGIHSIFKPYQISSVSLIGVEEATTSRKLSLTKFANVLEGILRCFNNLQEKLHASVFYFILPNFFNFASNGIYTPPVLIVIASLAVDLILTLKRLRISETSDLSHAGLMPVLFGASILSILYFYTSTTFPYYSFKGGERNVFLDHLAISIAFICSPVVLSFVGRSMRRGLASWIYLKCISNFSWALFLACYSCYNASTSFFIAIAVCPIVCYISTTTKFKKVLSMTMLLLISPPLALFYSQVFVAAVNTQTSTLEQLLSLVEGTANPAYLDGRLRNALIEREDFGVINWALLGFYALNWMFTWCLVVFSSSSTLVQEKKKTL